MPGASKWSIVLIGAVLACGVRLVGQATALGGEPAQKKRESAGQSALRRGWESMQAGRLREADLWLRSAWLDTEVRRQAAESLFTLHASDRFSLDVDESAVRSAEKALGTEFKRYESGHFIVLSDSDPSWVRSRTAMMESARREFYRVARTLDLPVIPHERKLLCILIDSYERFHEFSYEQDAITSSWIAGYYSLPHNRVVFYNDVTGPAFSGRLAELRERSRDARVRETGDGPARAHEVVDPRREADRARREVEQLASDFSTAKTVHETVHLLSFNTGLQGPSCAYPIWLSEGLASNFETSEAVGAFGPAQSNPERESAYQRLSDDGHLMPLRQLIGLAEVPGEDPLAVDQVYAQGHVLFSHLYATRRVSLGRYFEELGHRRGAATTAKEQLLIFERCFGSIESIEGELARRHRKPIRRDAQGGR